MNVRVEFDEKKLNNFMKEKGNASNLAFMTEVLKRSKGYVPRDTDSLLNSDYLIRDEKEGTVTIGYGSKYGDEKVNKVAIYQHERELNHYGYPQGLSMRDGTGSLIPGSKWALFGRSRSVPTEQISSYQRGYKQKKNTGQLTKYKAEWLLKALNDCMRDFGKIIKQISKK